MGKAAVDRRTRKAGLFRPAATTAALTGCATAIAAVLVLLTPARPLAAGRTVSFRTDDGVPLAATWYEPSTRQAPAVILVHMLRRSRHDWDAVGTRLASEGIGALALDLRGHGESGGPAATDGQYAVLVQDLTAARRFLASRPDVLPARLGIAGASIGASLAVLEASQAPGIVSLVLLSPSVDYRGLRIDAPLKKFAGRVLLVYSDDDPYAVRSTRELIKASAGARETLVVSHGGHGTNMLSHDDNLAGALVDWFKKTLL